jgi:hypothetical protein
MKTRLVVALFMSGVLAISASATESGAQNTNSSTGAALPAQAEAPIGTRVPERYTQERRYTSEDTITVDVWSSAASVAAEPKESEPDQLSLRFAHAALNAAFNMQSTERTLEHSLRRGFPISELWIQAALESIDNSLRQADLSATNDADRQALQDLQSQSTRLRTWTDWVIDAKRNMRLANYSMSASALDSDEQFQTNVGCTTFLVSMLSSRRLVEDYACR